MKILKGMLSIVCKDTHTVPTVQELCKADPRIIYVGNLVDLAGKVFHDAFCFTLRPAEMITLKPEEAKSSIDGCLIIPFIYHYLDDNHPVLQKLYKEYAREVYIGTVVEDQSDRGKVWHDASAPFLGSKRLYTKKADGKCEDVNAPHSYLSYCDRYRWRLTVEGKKGNEDYTFLYAVPAYNAWIKFFYTGKKAFHNLSPRIDKITDWEVREGMRLYGEELCNAFEASYKTEGFLKL